MSTTNSENVREHNAQLGTVFQVRNRVALGRCTLKPQVLSPNRQHNITIFQDDPNGSPSLIFITSHTSNSNANSFNFNAFHLHFIPLHVDPSVVPFPHKSNLTPKAWTHVNYLANKRDAI